MPQTRIPVRTRPSKRLIKAEEGEKKIPAKTRDATPEGVGSFAKAKWIECECCKLEFLHPGWPPEPITSCISCRET